MSAQCQQPLTPLEPEKGACQSTTEQKEATSPKPAERQEVARGGEPKSLGQRRSSHQAVARPVIIDVEESAGELEEKGAQGKISWHS